MTFLNCYTGSTPPVPDDDLAYNLGIVSDNSYVPSLLPDVPSQSPTGSDPVLSFNITNPLAVPMIALISFRASYIDMFDVTNYAGWEIAERLTTFTIEGATASRNGVAEPFTVSNNWIAATVTTFDQIYVQHKFELAAAQTITAELIDYVRPISDEVSPPSILIAGDPDGGYFIEATGWVPAP